MKFSLTLLTFLGVVSNVHAFRNQHGPMLHRRQANAAVVTSVSSSTSSSSSTSTTSVVSSTSSPAPVNTPASSPAAGTPATSATTSAVSAGTPTASTPSTPLTGAQTLTSGMPAEPTLQVATTYAAGASPPVSGAPALPTPFVFNAANWPAQDQVPDPNSPQVQEWMKELDGFTIPNINPTADGTCVGDPVAAANAANSGWWTCGGYTRSTDIVSCPDKLTWGVSFDDGPAPYTQTLLNYLSTKSILATFFVVGSRVIERPQVLLEEYMAGHDISVHTWSHRHLTTLTNEQIVAELGWSRLAIKTVLGVTPTTMRPPYGDIDDRVRAISLAMGMVPIIWTRGPTGNQYDTNDWQVAGGMLTGPQAQQSFQYILNNATVSNTGFILLEHDLFQVTTDLAREVFIPMALNHTPSLTLEPISKCNRIPTTNMYLESTTNTSFPYRNTTTSASSGSTTSAGVTYPVPLLSSLLLLGFAVIWTLL